MAMIRVPYPADPERRQALFHRAAAQLAKFGVYEGTPDAGIFRGKTPLGSFAGSYYAEVGTEVLLIDLTEKPWLVPTALVEAEVRRHMMQA